MIKEETIRSKSDEELVAIHRNPKDWIPEVCAWAEDELCKRGIDTANIAIRTDAVIKAEEKNKETKENVRFAKLFAIGLILLAAFLVIFGVAGAASDLSAGSTERTLVAGISVCIALFAVGIGFVGIQILRGNPFAAHIGFWLSVVLLVLCSGVFFVLLLTGKISFGLIGLSCILLFASKGMKAIQKQTKIEQDAPTNCEQGPQSVG